MPASDAIRVEGLRELNRAFARADRVLNAELKDGLRDAADPVRADAEALAVSGIPRIGLPWSRMRVGVTQKLVYVAPKERGRKRGRRRPNLAGLLTERAMVPALEQNTAEVERRVGRVLDTVGREWERKP